MCSYYYFSLPYEELSIHIKNVFATCLAKWIRCNVYEGTLSHMDEHAIIFKWVRYEQLPPYVLQRTLEDGIEGYTEQPCYVVKQEMTMAQLYEKIQSDPEFKAKCTSYSYKPPKD